MSTSEDPDERRVVAAVEDDRAELVSTARRLLAADTQNPPGGTRELVEWIAGEFRSLGLAVEQFGVDPRKPNLLATLPGERSEVLLYNGHLDTVPFDAATWEHDPLGERVGNRLYGRGATDMKGGVAAMIQVARAYARTETTPPVTLQFAFVSDEEVGGDAGLGDRVRSGELTPDACVVGEATGREDVDSVAVGDRGYVWPTIAVEGEAAHGSRPALGTNAVDLLYEVVEDCRERLRDLSPATDVVDDDVIEGSVRYYATDLPESAARELFDSPTVNLGVLDGGEAVNSVPASARARLDVRIRPGVDPETVIATVCDCLGEYDRASMPDVAWSEGTYTDPASAFVEAVVAAADRTLSTPVHRRLATGSGDASTFREAGVPTVEFATGTGTVHGSDEYTTVDKLRDDAVAYARLPFEFARRLD